MKTYTLQVTEVQLRAISGACEVLARLGIGQFRFALEQLPMKEYIPNGWHEDMDLIQHLLARHIGDAVEEGCEAGFYSRNVKDRSKIAWDIYTAARHRLSWDKAVDNGVVDSIHSPRKWPEMSSVIYDVPMCSGGQPLMRIEANEAN